MKKKEFQKLIKENKEIFVCVCLEDSTIRHGYPHCSVVVYWKGGIGKKSFIKTMRGNMTDSKNIDILNKYKDWSAE